MDIHCPSHLPGPLARVEGCTREDDNKGSSRLSELCLVEREGRGKFSLLADLPHGA